MASLGSVLKPGGKLWMMCFSDKEPGTDGPRRVSQPEISDAFSDGWDVLSITAVQLTWKASSFQTVDRMRSWWWCGGNEWRLDLAVDEDNALTQARTKRWSASSERLP